jgi:NADPH-dependent 2,4-dienoyl-CoA reductase/sulfur reductase-like enzyme
MKRLRIIVIGGTAAGPSAAAKAVRTNPNAEVTLFEQTETVSYGVCEIPYAVAGEIQDETKLVIYSPEELKKQKGFDVKTQMRVESINVTKKWIFVRDLRSGGVIEHGYDRLILATGARPKRLGVHGENGRNVFYIRSRGDTLALLRYIESEKPKHAVVIGGGYVGVEMCEALRRKSMDVTLLHRRRLPLSGLEEETRERVHEELLGNEVSFISNVRVESLLQNSSGKAVHVLTNRGTFECDLVVVAIGVLPNVELAKTARVGLGSTGAIATDQRQQTNIDGIYAAGDCCEVKNLVSGQRAYVPLATLAARQGRVAGENAAGGRATFGGAIRAAAVRVFGIEVAHVGLGSEEARGAGFDVSTQTITSWSRIEMMPGSAKVTVKLIMDKRSKRLLGANLSGAEGVVQRANTLGVAIQHRMTVDQISSLDLIYAPPFSPLWDPILVAANKGKQKL